MSSKRSVVERMRDLAGKWVSRSTGAQPDYVREVSRPDVWQLWQANAAAAAPTYNAAMQDVINRNVWGTVMGRIDPRVYGELVRAKADRRLSGIQISGPRWFANFSPIADAIDRVRPTLSPRGPKMSDANMGRFMGMIQAIHGAAQARRGLTAGVGSSAGVGSPPLYPGYPYYSPGGGHTGPLPGVWAPPVPNSAGVAAAQGQGNRPQLGSYLGYGGY